MAGAGGGAVTARAGAGASDREGAGRRGAGFACRGGRGAARGAVTVTSGNVSDIWPQAASTRNKGPDDTSAPSAAACNKRRFAATSRDAPRPRSPAPRIAPIDKCLINSETFGQGGSHDILPIHIGNIWQCGRGDTGCMSRRDPPVPRGCQTATLGSFRELCGRNVRARATFVESIM